MPATAGGTWLLLKVQVTVSPLSRSIVAVVPASLEPLSGSTQTMLSSVQPGVTDSVTV